MSERLRFRQPTAEDLGAYEAHFLDPEIGRWLRPPPLHPFTAREVLELLDRDQRHWSEHDFGPWVLSDPESDELVGRGGLAWSEVDGRLAVELPWSIVSSRWGEGLATAAAEQAIATARDLGFERVVALVLPYNHASRRVAEKAGMRASGEVEHVGLPHVLYRAELV